MKANKDRLIAFAERLARIFDDRCALIGGMAVSAWGHVRATQDVDFVCRSAPEEIVELLEAEGFSVQLRRGNVLDGDLEWVIRGKAGRFRFDVLAPPVEIDWEACTRVEIVDGVSVQLIGLADLIQLKLKAGGNRDLWDVAKLLQLHPEHRETALKTAADLRVDERLQNWIDDPRL
ncbi:MAG: hypothetical protein A2289_13070 [Deltaproteobacteria bacterium RIFOXYA12_FULL_58_15]|nr:MAG: hypothetical protein A2289_13070 [Deltaproteobacteria bacterium RIFOXYA12_FULL_58_15]OGR09424.1 MAG: hypothetical protein A2341_18050 [Deltaproteobacteria bacterium RIFOXYB12_FULL_58_9]